MEKSFWDRYQELKDSINGHVEPMDSVTLQTRFVKKILGAYLLQATIFAFWWSIETGGMHPWLMPMTTLMGVGVFWSKVTDSWKYARGYRYQQVPVEGATSTTRPVPQARQVRPPTINIQNVPITGRRPTSVSVELDLESASESIYEESFEHPLSVPDSSD